MTGLLSRVYTAAQVRELDRRAIEDHGIDGHALMERAGAAAFRLLRLRWPAARRLLVCCGRGNNGGDGLVVARLARAAGLQVEVALHGEPDRLDGAAARAWRAWEAVDGRHLPLEAMAPEQADVVVDGLLGTGLDREVRGGIATAIERINRCGTPTLALDIPSGVHADTGAVLGVAIRATVTTTFIGAKRGLYTGAAVDCVGAVFLDDLGTPPALHEDLGEAVGLIDAGMTRSLPGRRPGAHKGDAGHLLVVGGDHGFGGAARMAGEAALRAGAGLVSVATRPDHAATLAGARPELMAHPVDEPESQLPALLDRADAVGLGPGLGRSPWSRAALATVLGRGAHQRVLDADALNLLAESEPGTPGEAVLTPHPGEAARLLGETAATIQADRFTALQALLDRFGATVLLKGAGTLVGQPGREPAMLPGARPAMAVGGMGDILTGIIGSLMVQGLDSWTAATAGCWLHADATDRAAARRGAAGLLPTDLLESPRGGEADG